MCIEETPPPRRESPGRTAKTNAAKNITLLSCINRHAGDRLPSRPPRDLSPPPLAPRVSVALNNLFAAVPASKDSSSHEEGGGVG